MDNARRFVAAAGLGFAKYTGELMRFIQREFLSRPSHSFFFSQHIFVELRVIQLRRACFIPPGRILWGTRVPNLVVLVITVQERYQTWLFWSYSTGGGWYGRYKGST